MKATRIIAGLVLSAVLVTSVSAMTGHQLKEVCSAEDLSWNNGFCSGFIMGAADAFPASNRICIPEGVTYEQVRDVVRKYLGDHPEKLQKLAHGLVEEAIRKAFPCS